MTNPSSPTAVAKAVDAARQTQNIFLQMTPARAQRALETNSSPGQLAGLPFVVKDVFDVRGTRTSAASQLFDRRPHAQRDAEAVRRVTAAGARLIGKTTMSELAYSGVGVNERFGTPTISRDGCQYVVGGSSSGAAAAVHAGVVAFALASDTSGSGRIPAAWAGVLGFRPSLARYPTSGLTPLAPTLDTVAVLAADLDHIELLDRILAPRPAPPPTSAGLEAGFVVPHEEYLAGCDHRVLERFHSELARLKTQGHRIVQRRIEALDTVAALHERHVPIVETEALARFHSYLDHPGLLSPLVRTRLEEARARSHDNSSAALYAGITTLRRQFTEELGSATLLSPPVQIDAPTLAEVRDCAEYHNHVNRRCLAMTMVLSYLDAPSVVVPTGHDEQGRPASLQLSCGSGADQRVLEAARTLTAPSGRNTSR